MKSKYREGIAKKGGAETVYRFKEGLGWKEGVVFLRGGGGVDTPMHNMFRSRPQRLIRGLLTIKSTTS